MYVEKDTYYYIERLYNKGVVAINTKRNCGDFSDESLLNLKENHISEFISRFKKKYKIIYAKQSHSNNIKIIDENSKQYYENVDGFITERKDVVLLTKYADCLPIYFYDKKNSVIGIAHSGWKGTYNEIYKSMIQIFEKQYNSEKDDIIIALGVGIKNCCYEVGLEFYEKFNQKFDKEIIAKVFKIENEKIYFDNEALNYELLLKEGILKENLIVSEKCTYCSEKFFSYRKGDKYKRDAAMIFFK